MAQGIRTTSSGTPIQPSFSQFEPSSEVSSPDINEESLGQQIEQIETAVEVLKSATGKGRKVDAFA